MSDPDQIASGWDRLAATNREANWKWDSKDKAHVSPDGKRRIKQHNRSSGSVDFTIQVRIDEAVDDGGPPLQATRWETRGSKRYTDKDEAIKDAKRIKVAKKYPTPKEVAKAAKDGAEAIYDARSKALADLRGTLQDAYEDSTSTGVSFKGDFPSQRLKDARDELAKVDSHLMRVASMLEALARDLKKA